MEVGKGRLSLLSYDLPVPIELTPEENDVCRHQGFIGLAGRPAGRPAAYNAFSYRDT